MEVSVCITLTEKRNRHTIKCWWCCKKRRDGAVRLYKTAATVLKHFQDNPTIQTTIKQTVMKKYKILFLAGLSALLVWSCEADELITFAGGEAFIYLNRPRVDVDTYFVQHRNFATTNPHAEYIIMYAQVRIAGDVVDYDRPIAFELTTPNLTDHYGYINVYVRDEHGDFVYIDVTDEYGNPIYDEYGVRIRERKQELIRFEWQSGRGAGFPLMVEGRDIELLPSYVRAGRVSDTLRVRINNTQFIKENWGLAVITLNANEHFRNDFIFSRDSRGRPSGDQRLRFYFFATNTSEMPRLWAAAANAAAFNNTVGTFSIAKYHLMMKVGGFDDTLLNELLPGETYTTALSRAIGSRGGLFVLARAVLAYMTEEYERTGVWPVDEFGHEIRMHSSVTL